MFTTSKVSEGGTERTRRRDLVLERKEQGVGFWVQDKREQEEKKVQDNVAGKGQGIAQRGKDGVVCQSVNPTANDNEKEEKKRDTGTNGPEQSQCDESCYSVPLKINSIASFDSDLSESPLVPFARG